MTRKNKGKFMKNEFLSIAALAALIIPTASYSWSRDYEMLLESLPPYEETLEYIRESSKQKEFYLLRKYTSLCAGKPFDEKWRYKTKPSEIVQDAIATNEAYKLLVNDDDVRRCLQECAYYNKTILSLRTAAKRFEEGVRKGLEEKGLVLKDEKKQKE